MVHKFNKLRGIQVNLNSVRWISLMILKEFAVKPLWKKKLAITDKMVAKNLHHFDVFTIIFR